MRRELGLSAKSHAPLLRTLSALACPRQDQVPLELRSVNFWSAKS
jgi:hypothetical protein